MYPAILLLLSFYVCSSLDFKHSGTSWAQSWILNDTDPSSHGYYNHSVQVVPRSDSGFRFDGSNTISFFILEGSDSGTGLAREVWYDVFVRGKSNGFLMKAPVLARNRSANGDGYEIVIPERSLPTGDYDLIIRIDRYSRRGYVSGEKMSAENRVKRNGSLWYFEDSGQMDNFGNGWNETGPGAEDCLGNAMIGLYDFDHVLGTFAVNNTKFQHDLPSCIESSKVVPKTIGGVWFTEKDCETGVHMGVCCDASNFKAGAKAMYREANCCYPPLKTTTLLLDRYLNHSNISFVGDSTIRGWCEFIQNLTSKAFRGRISCLQASHPMRWGLRTFLSKNYQSSWSQKKLDKSVQFGDTIIWGSCLHDMAYYKLNDPDKKNRNGFKDRIVKQYKQNLPGVVRKVKGYIKKTMKKKRVIWLSCTPNGYTPSGASGQKFNFAYWAAIMDQAAREVVEHENWSFVDLYSMGSTALGNFDWLGHPNIHYNLVNSSMHVFKVQAQLVLSHVVFEGRASDF